MPIDVQRALAAIGEPRRFEIVRLLDDAPRTVGEIASELGALQPQTTKHIQALEAAGLVHVHILGRRRVVRLRRDSVAALAEHFTRLATARSDEAELDAYEQAILDESARRRVPEDVRVLRFERALEASAAAVWDAWTDPARAAQWWAPRHFTVGAFEFAPSAGSPIRIVLREGDSAEYESRGRVDEVEPGRRLVFDLAPVDEAGAPWFYARHTLTLEEREATILSLVIEVTRIRPGAVAMIAGLEPGWRQLFDALESFVA